MVYTVGSLFAGIGGICIAFKDAGCTIKWANELDVHACKTYRHNSSLMGNARLIEGDVVDFIPSSDDRVDIITAGFPCQPYSVAGNMKGVEDPRGLPMFMEVVNKAVACDCSVIFMENVAQLKTINGGDTFREYMRILSENGYPFYHPLILNTKDYGGIAQFRNRLYVCAFKKESDRDNYVEKIKQKLTKIPVTKGFFEIIDISGNVDVKYRYNSARMIRFERDVKPVATEISIFYQYRRDHTRTNMNGLCPTLTASMGIGGHNVPLVNDGVGVRQITPEECLQLQGFPEDYNFPEGSDRHKYKQAGNSVSVPVVANLALILVESLTDSDD